MKLHLNAVPVIVTAVFLLSMVGLRESAEDRWLADAIVVTPPVLTADSVAYPGAVGWGADALTTCIDDTIVVEHVTNMTDNTGPGTLDSILNNAQHGDTLTIVVWDVGGRATIGPSNAGYTGQFNCTYLAMQTAPGGGAAYRRGRMFTIEDNSKDFVIRGGTFQGDGRQVERLAQIYIQDAQRFILAENDFFWNEGEKMPYLGVVSNFDTVRYVTLDRNLYAQPQDVEGTQMQITEQDATNLLSHVTLTRSIFHSGAYRQPMVTTAHAIAKYDATPRARVLGNIWFNGRQGHIEVRGRYVDVIDGYVKTGAMTYDGVPSGSDYSWLATLFWDNSGRPDSATSLYVERLIGVHNRDTTTTTDSLWYPASKAEVACFYNNCQAAGGGDVRDSLDAGIKRDTAMTPPTFPTPRVNPFNLVTQLAGTATDSGQVGNYRRIQCDGTWAYRADSVHSALLKEVRDSTGVSALVDSAFVAARYLYTKSAGAACDDTDGDGMPNAFEDRFASLDKNSATDRSTDYDGDGFSAMEEYVNGTDAEVYTYSDGSEATGSSTTYGNGRSVYYLSFRLDTTEEGRIVRLPDADSLAQVVGGFRIYAKPSALRGVLLTCDTVSAWLALDSAETVDSLAVWGMSPSPPMRSVNLPGC